MASDRPMDHALSVLARGPWAPGAVDSSWIDEPYRAAGDVTARADAEVAALRARGAPVHDGVAARLVAFSARAGRLRLELQPARWALRLVPAPDARSLSVLCLVRDADGRWLAGRRAGWVASWAGRWALGAAGAVDVGEDPAAALGRELAEEWSVVPESLSVEALVRRSAGLVLLVGVARLARAPEVVPDHEHDAFSWWPPDPGAWPGEADEALRRLSALLS